MKWHKINIPPLETHGMKYLTKTWHIIFNTNPDAVFYQRFFVKITSTLLDRISFSFSAIPNMIFFLLLTPQNKSSIPRRNKSSVRSEQLSEQLSVQLRNRFSVQLLNYGRQSSPDWAPQFSLLSVQHFPAAEHCTNPGCNIQDKTILLSNDKQSVLIISSRWLTWSFSGRIQQILIS